MANEAEVDLVVSTAGALPQLERQLSQIIRQTENDADAIDVGVAIQAREAARTLSAQIGAVVNNTESRIDPIEVGVLIDQRDALQTLDRQLSEIVTLTNRGAVVDDPVLIQAVIDGPESLRNMRAELGRVVDSVEDTAPEIEVEVEIDRDAEQRLRSLRQEIGQLSTRSVPAAARSFAGLATTVGTLTVASGALLNTLVAVGGALTQVAPAAAVLTSAMVAQKLVAGTLKLALNGVQDAIEDAFDPDISVEDFHKSLEKLAPEAAKFVDEIHTIRRELRAIQQGVQNRVFRNLDEDLRSLTKTAGPTVTRALNRTADSLNSMARGAAAAAVQMSQQGVLGQALDGATSALQNLEKVPARAVRSFSFLAAASAPALNRIALAVDAVSLRIQDKLQRAFESGALERAIDTAVATIAQLGRVIGNFGAGVQNIFAALTTDGGGLFAILEKVSQAFEDLTASREFQVILQELSDTASVLVDNILPLIQEAFVQLAPVIETLAPVVRDFITAIGPELIPVIEELGPILVDLALIMREQLPLAIDLAKAAIDVIVIGLKALGLAMDLARQGSEKFSQFYESDFIESFRAASNAAITHRDILKSAFINWTSSAFNSVRTFQNALGDFSTSLRDRFTAAVIESLGSVLRAVRNFVAEFVNVIANLPDRAYDIGVNIMSGLAGGLTSGIGKVIGIARNIADAVSGTIESALDINSPSRVMRQIGRDTVEGFRLGMKDKLPGVRDLANTIATIATGVGTAPATVAVGNINNLGGPQIGNIPKPTLERQRITNIYLGGKLIEQIIDDRIKAKSNQNVRIRSQGVRI